MAVISCAAAITCPGTDNPVTNYSAEGPEQKPQCFSLVFPSAWDKPGCISVCSVDGTIESGCDAASQNEADVCALAMESACPPDPDCFIPPCVPPPIFYSQATSCVCVNAGGSSFFYFVPGGIFSGPTQAIADALAQSYACVQCHREGVSFRLGAIATELCISESVTIVIPATGVARPVGWFVVAGALPAGLFLNALTGVIHGTPTASGTHAFTIRANSADLLSSNYAQRSYSLCVVEIIPATLANGTVGVAYVTSFSAGCASASLSWQVVSGALPPGLALNELTGELSGTPTLSGTYSFRLQVSTGAT